MTTTIAIQESTRDLLKFYGHKDETYDEIIKKLVKLADKQKFFDEQKYILENEEFHKVEDL